jgi:hypothetical protein
MKIKQNGIDRGKKREKKFEIIFKEIKDEDRENKEFECG